MPNVFCFLSSLLVHQSLDLGHERKQHRTEEWPIKTKVIVGFIFLCVGAWKKTCKPPKLSWNRTEKFAYVGTFFYKVSWFLVWKWPENLAEAWQRKKYSVIHRPPWRMWLSCTYCLSVAEAISTGTNFVTRVLWPDISSKTTLHVISIKVWR
jgi:hypothetical protein